MNANNLTVKYGDIFDLAKELKSSAICCTTNLMTNGLGNLIMGAGVALRFAQEFPWLPKIWGEEVRKGNKGLIVTDDGIHNPYYLIAFPTKSDWKQPSKVWLIEQSAKQLSDFAEKLDLKNIILPKPGCQYGGLKWEDVEPLLLKTLKTPSRYIIVDRAENNPTIKKIPGWINNLQRINKQGVSF